MDFVGLAKKYWIAAVVVAVVLFFLIRVQMAGGEEGFQNENARNMRCSYAISNYMENKKLHDQYEKESRVNDMNMSKQMMEALEKIMKENECDMTAITGGGAVSGPVTGPVESPPS